MIALIQRVTQATVTLDDVVIARIDAGVLALVGAERDDNEPRAKRLAERVLDYRIFADPHGRMNIGARDARKPVLAVPQFTLAADTRRGNRPGFSPACRPEIARGLYDQFVWALQAGGVPVESGRFGADMRVTSTNDGPVTFWLHS